MVLSWDNSVYIYNIKKYLKTTPLDDILNIKYIYCNFVTTTNVPTGTPSLLGLNLKFCIKTPNPYEQIKDKNIKRFKNGFKTHFRHNIEEQCNRTINDYNNRNNFDKNQYIPKLYIRPQLSTQPTHPSAELLLDKFEDKIKSLRNKKYNNRITIQIITNRKLLMNYINKLIWSL